MPAIRREIGQGFPQPSRRRSPIVNQEMSRKIAGPEIERLVQLFARLPGLGPRSARKAVLALLKRRNDLLLPLSDALQQAVAKISECPVCGNLDTVVPCSICPDPRRDQSLIVVVEEVGDLWALERAALSPRAIMSSAAICLRSTASDRSS